MATYTFTNTSTGRVGTIQSWTVPTTGTYRIEAWGAGGGWSYLNGTSTPNPGGLGAKMQAEFDLVAGQVLKILVGQQGVDYATSSRGAGGGGGSFIWKASDNSPLIIAGGGGGGGQYATVGRIHAVTTANGQAGELNGAVSGAGGTNGNGGTGVDYGQGGAGWLGNGGAMPNAGGSIVPGRPLDTTYPGYGGAKPTSWSDSVDGGFGGGGASYAGSGGGGGYSGGGGGGWSNSGNGGGAGSYNGGIRQVNTAAARSGHGLVLITTNAVIGITPHVFSADIQYTAPAGRTYVEWGTTSGTYPNTLTFKSPGGTSTIEIGGLSLNATYYCRLRNDSGIIGWETSFTTRNGLVYFSNEALSNITVETITASATISGINE